MKGLTFKSLAAILIAILLVVSCKKEKDGNGYIKPSTASAEIVKVPAAISANTTDANVMMINSYAQMVNAFGSYSQLLGAIPDNAEKSELKSTGTSWHWSYTYGEITVNYWVELTEGTLGNTWKLYIQGEEFINKTLVVEAYEDNAGLEGYLKIYAFDQESAAVTYTWSKLNNTTTATLLFSYDGESMFFAFNSNADGSGDMKVYYGSSAAATKIVDMTWTASGHGTWWVKNPDNNAVAEGTF